MQFTELPTTTLYYREGNSDKVYQANIIEASPHLFHVTFAYGRRGSTLTAGRKTGEAVPFSEAQAIYDKLVREKMAKGYTEGPEGTPYTSGSIDKQPSGTLPQLLNPIEESEVYALIHSPDWCLQEKFDGRRMLMVKEEVAIHGLNKKGSLIGLPETVYQAAQLFDGRCILDGESIGDTFHAFDILELDGVDVRHWGYRDRLTTLINLLASVQQRAIKYVETAYTPDQKRRMFENLKASGKEGVVFKRLDAPYTSGRPNSRGTQLKHKFTASLSAVVSKINGKRSVELRLLNGEGWVPVGNVTIPVNQAIPPIGQVVEVRYLYAFSESRCLFQPVYLGKRTDVEQHECVVSQLKYKADEE